MSAIPLLSGHKRTFGERVEKDASDQKRSFVELPLDRLGWHLGERPATAFPWRAARLLGSPRIAHDSFASVASGDLGEFALKGCRRRPAIQPFHLDGCSRQR